MKILTLTKLRTLTSICLVTCFISIAFWLSSLSPKPNLLRGSQSLAVKEIFNFKRRKKALLIVTSFRSGSSFLGQYFNQRKDTFFFYEPLLTLGHNCAKQSHDIRRVAYLRNLFKCEIEDQLDMQRGADLLSNEHLMKLVEKNCIPSNFCFRENMRSLCTEEFCYGRNSSSCINCGPVNIALASRKCRLADIVVIKVIRICDLENLKPLLEDPSLDVKILELIRDPRGVYSSRERLNHTNLQVGISDTCNTTARNWKTAQRKENEWIKNKYKAIRYEDICQNPLEMGRQIYNFAGLNMTQEMEQWIKANTQGDISYPLNERANLLLERIKAEKTHQRRVKRQENIQKDQSNFDALNDRHLKNNIFDDPFTTIRISSENWRKWTSELNFLKVESIQDVCSEMMSIFNYLLITEEDKLKNKSTVVMEKFCPGNNLALNKHISC